MWESRANRIEHSGPEYVYEQIADDLAADMGSGALSPGSRLPSAQELAEIYGVARLTARRAIKHLEDQELVVVRPGKGTFVNRGRA